MNTNTIVRLRTLDITFHITGDIADDVVVERIRAAFDTVVDPITITVTETSDHP